MKAILGSALAVSVGANVWLLATRGDAPDAVSEGGRGAAAVPVAPGREAAPRAGAPSPGLSGDAPLELTEMRERIAALEADLAAARENAETLDALDPVAILVYSRKPLAWKARQLLAIEPEKARWAALAKVSAVLNEREDTAKELLAALRSESDPAVLEMLGRFVASGLAKASPDDRRAFAALLRDGPSPAARAAAVRGAFVPQMPGPPQGEEAKALAAELNESLRAAIRSDPSPEVAGEIARAIGNFSPSADDVAALREAAARLPASAGRRAVWEAIARGSFLSDQGAALAQEFEAASAQDVRDDIAAGIARAGNSMSSSMGGTPEQQQKRLDDARARFLSLYGKTSDATVRPKLLRAALHGLGCVPMILRTDEQKASAAKFFRDVAALEPEALLREKVERVAAAFEEKGGAAVMEFDRIMKE